MTDVEEIPTQLPPGARLADGQYTITRFLASGGFGMTYMAQDRFGRDVVIKECFPAGLSRRTHDTRVRPASKSSEPTFEKCVALFLREAETLAGLRSPHVVNVLTAFTENGTAYMVMSYVEGSDFQTIIDTAPERLTPDYVMMFAHGLLSAVATVHAANILHRDIKPGNILVDRDGKPVLIDFGAARVEATKQSVKLSTLPVVADGYSPNEFYITGVEQGPASDLYSVAATLYAAITRVAPPPAPQRYQALPEQKSDPLVPLVGNHPEYPESFLASIDQSLSLSRRDRIQSAPEWLAMIRPALPESMLRDRDHTIAAPPPEQLPPKPVLGKVLLASVAGLAIGAAAMAAVGGRFGGEEVMTPADIAAWQTRATEAESEVDTLRGQLRVGAGQLSQAERRIGTLSAQLEEMQQQSETEIAQLERQVQAAESDAQRLRRQLDSATERDGTQVATLRGQLRTSEARVAELEPELAELRTQLREAEENLRQVRQNSESRIAQLEAALRERRPEPSARAEGSASILPASVGETGGTTLVPTRPEGPAVGLDAWRRDTFATETLRGHTDVVRAVAFSPDGETIVSGGNDNTVRVWDGRTGRLRETLQGHEKDVTSVAFSPDGRFFISASDEGRINVWDARRLSRDRVIETGNTFVQSAVVGPGGDRIAAGLPDGSVRIWEGRDTAPDVISAHGDWVSGVAFSPDGRLLVSGSYDRTVRVWDLDTESPIATLDDADAWISSVTFAPDGATIYATTQDAMLLVWGRASSGDWQRAEAPVGGVSALAVAPSGTFIATGSDDGQVQLRDPDLRIRRVLGGHGDTIRAVAVGPEGGRIISASDDGTLRLLTLDR